MKKIIYVIAALSTIILCLALGALTATVNIAGGATEATSTVQTATTTRRLSRAQGAWLGALEWCESRGQIEAINPKDRDGTPSYGFLQFKPSTFKNFAKLYGINSTSTMDADAQEAIVTQMILRGGVDWHQQFPECTRKLGTPPKNPLTSIDKN